MPRSYVSVVSPVIALLGTVGLAYALGIGPFHNDPYADDLTASDEETSGYLVFGCPSGESCDEPDEPIPGSDEPPALEDESPSVDEPDTRTPLPPAVKGVHTLFDDNWLVEEGQWSLGEADVIYEASEGSSAPSFTEILESVGSKGAYVSTPGFYGYYPTVVELHERAPRIPSWCQDVAEVSIRIGGERPAFSMGSFETFSDSFAVPAGSYRVRYCTEKQDVAATQDEFTGDKYTVYAGRHLLQLWKAPHRSDRVLREGSRWARDLSK